MWKKGERRDRSIPGARRTEKKKSDLIRRKKRETDDGGKQKKGQRYQRKKIMKLRKISRTDIRLRIWCLHSCHNES